MIIYFEVSIKISILITIKYFEVSTKGVLLLGIAVAYTVFLPLTHPAERKPAMGAGRYDKGLHGSRNLDVVTVSQVWLLDHQGCLLLLRRS